MHRNQINSIECQAAFAENREDLYSDPVFLKRLNGIVDRALAQHEYLSLDVFDTLLLRGPESELHRFVEVGRRFSEIARAFPGISLPPGQMDGFVARMSGTRASYKLRPLAEGKYEGSFAEILRVAAGMFVADGVETLAGQFHSAELEFEAEHLKISQFWLDRINRHRATGGKCILVTDMYMCSGDVCNLLNLLKVPDATVNNIYSSADEGVTKASGKIFGLIEKHLSARAGSFFHVGDNFEADYCAPRRAGWQALHLPVPETELDQRAADHAETASQLQREYRLSTDISAPCDGFTT